MTKFNDRVFLALLMLLPLMACDGQDPVSSSSPLAKRSKLPDSGTLNESDQAASSDQDSAGNSVDLGVRTGNGIAYLYLNNEPAPRQEDPIIAQGSDEVYCLDGVEDVQYLGQLPSEVSIVLWHFTGIGGYEIKASFPNVPTALSFILSPGDLVHLGCNYVYRDEDGNEIISILNDLTSFYLEP